MLAITDHALVLLREKHLEHDVRLTLLLRKTGKVIVVAKGVRKTTSKLKAIVEPFIEADVQVMLPEHGVYGRLINGRLLCSHLSIRSNLPAFGAASRCVEVIHQLIPHRVPTEEVYDILRDTLQALNHQSDPESYWITFVVRLLHQLGHGDISPDLKGRTASHCLAVINQHLERHLEKRLKSEVHQFS